MSVSSSSPRALRAVRYVLPPDSRPGESVLRRVLVHVRLACRPVELDHKLVQLSDLTEVIAKGQPD